ncbi:hypothetical protein [Viridibacillus arvi]|uniref:hypothetical protein n=1 Tax=Viridibacillus arvi TaxID=263475 RepID=UPI0034CDFE09
MKKGNRTRFIPFETIRIVVMMILIAICIPLLVWGVNYGGTKSDEMKKEYIGSSQRY